jgi:ABC-2 type transport system ATP-binding protein
MRKRLAIAGALALLALAPSAASARDVTVRSFDGTKINAHYFPAAGLAPGGQAPTILQGPGWSQTGETQTEGSTGVGDAFGISGIEAFIKHGYNVVTWDPRGFGQSGGTVQIDDPRYEGRDVQALLDYVATQPEAQREKGCYVKVRGKGKKAAKRRRARKRACTDPRVGMAGGSYGGGIQLITAAIDKRVDAIAPTIAWHSLLTSVFPESNIKLGWGSLLIGLGVVGTLPGGASDPANIAGRQDPHFYSIIENGLATGTVPQSDLDWMASHGPADLVKKVKVPTLFIQGTVDTLFPLDEAVTNFAQLRRNRVKVKVRKPAKKHGKAAAKRKPRLKVKKAKVPTKMIWFCGGHGACFTGNGPSGYLTGRQLSWFDRYLKGEKVDTGPLFSWIADDGDVRDSGGYPLKSAGELTGSGSGTLPIAPGQGSGGLIFASQAPISVNVDIAGPAADANVVGAPRVDLTYTGTGAPQKTWVFAQIVNPRNGLVVGNIATPIPVVLDGQEHTLSRELEMIAARAPEGGGYTLQLTPSSTLYDLQRSAGTVDFSAIKVSLPLGEATPAKPVKVKKPKQKRKTKQPGA